MTGPNIPPILAVPCFWTANTAVSTTAAIGHTQWLTAGAARVTPSIAPSTEIAGRDDAVAVEQRGAEEPERDQEPCARRRAG